MWLQPVSLNGAARTASLMLLGGGILAVPTCIVTVEMASQRLTPRPTTGTCDHCLTEGHEAVAKACKECSAKLPDYQQ